jgi:hypothetical protein
MAKKMRCTLKETGTDAPFPKLDGALAVRMGLFLLSGNEQL